MELKKKKPVENTSPCLDLHSEAHAHLRMDLRYPSHSHPQILSFKEFLATRNLLPHGELAEGSPERHEAVRTWWKKVALGVWWISPFS